MTEAPSSGSPSGRDDPLIPCDRLCRSTVRPEDTFDAFWDASAEVYDIAIPDLETERKRGLDAAAWRLDNLVFVKADLSPNSCSRSRKRVQDCNMNFLQLSVGEGAPESRLIVGDTIYSTTGAGAYLTDFAQPHTESAGNDDYIAVFIPYEAIGYDPARHQPFLVLPEETAAGRVLTDAWKSMCSRLDSIRESEANAVAAGLCGLVRGLMLRDGQMEETRECVKEARVRAMHSFLETNLRNPDLGMDELRANFGASRSTIFRDFAPSGGLDRYILRRRLERAYLDLADTPATRGRITQVAEAWGFASMSHFYRVFRSEFGCAPGDVIAKEAESHAAGCDDPSGLVSSLPITSWLSHISNGAP